MFGKDKKEEFHEKILYEAQPNIFVYSKGILISMFVLGFLFFLYSAGIRYIGNMNVYLIESTKTPLTTYFALAIFVFIMIVILYIILKLLIWTSIKYTITESRVIVEKGILLQKKNYMPFNTIQDVSRTQSLLGKIFSVGTITLYSAYDGKEMELKDVSSPKKIEDLIFENMRGTHLRRPNHYNDNYVDGYEFNPIRPNSNEPVHYRRMEDLDDLELVDAKQRKKELREIRRKARNSRNNNSNYDSGYDNSNYSSRYDNSNYSSRYDNSNYSSGYDDYYEPAYDSYRDNRYAEGRPRDDFDYRNSHYEGRRGYPDSHHHQYSGAIKESYERNPDKYFANNYEEFHQSNLDAQNDYYERRDYVPERPVRDNYESYEEKNNKSKGLSRFNPFSSSKKEDSYEENISDEEFDSTINQAMHDMDSNIRFEPSNNQYNQSNDYNRGYHSSNRDYDQSYNQSHNQSYNQSHNQSYNQSHNQSYNQSHNQSYDQSYNHNRAYRPTQDMGRNRDVRDDYYAPRKQHNNPYDDYKDSYSSSYRNDNRYDSRSRSYDDRGYDNYNQSRNQSRNYNQSRRNNDRYNQNHHYESNDYSEEYTSDNEKGNKEKTPDDLFEKHSRKFRR